MSLLERVLVAVAVVAFATSLLITVRQVVALERDVQALQLRQDAIVREFCTYPGLGI